MGAPTPGVFLTWNDSRRSATLARTLGVERVTLVAQRNGPLRHPAGAAATARWLFAARPRLVWFQFSLALGVVLAVYQRLARGRGVRLAVDVHSKALRRSGPWWLRWAVLPVKRWAFASCHAVLVSNEVDARYAEEVLRAPALILPDPLPEPPVASAAEWQGGGQVVFVCSYDVDEPVPLILEAARRIAPHATVVLTGDTRPLDPGLRAELERVATLPGRLPEAEYWGLLRGAGCIVVLTTDTACLPCGAYEAIVLGKRPVLASDPTRERVFGEAGVFAELSADGVADAVLGVLERGRQGEGPAVPAAFRARWVDTWRSVRARLMELGIAGAEAWGPEGEPAVVPRADGGRQRLEGTRGVA
ncbi:MAG TPA: hypothetical protein VFQ76_15095 [Longimicrobiaceae bacterium]|nr:hypothetical protein [Longimicrobiaceae bacterium]